METTENNIIHPLWLGSWQPIQQAAKIRVPAASTVAGTLLIRFCNVTNVTCIYSPGSQIAHENSYEAIEDPTKTMQIVSH